MKPVHLFTHKAFWDRAPRHLIWSSFLATVLTTSGCNQVFYQPMREIVATPDKIGIAWDSYQIKAPSGEKIALWHLKSSEKPKAVVIHLHGNAENRSTHMYFTGWMTQNACDVIIFDYRGYGDSEGIATRESTIEDAGAVIKWTRENPKFKDLPIIALGQSLGGAVIIPTLAWFAKQTPAQTPVDGLILDSTFSSYRRIARQKLGSFWLTWPLQYPLALLVSDDLSPNEFAGQITIPVLQFHSRRDHVVPFELGRALFTQLGSHQKEFIEVSPPGHTTALGAKTDEFRERL